MDMMTACQCFLKTVLTDALFVCMKEDFKVVTVGQAMIKERGRRRKEGAPQEVIVAVERNIVAFFAQYLGMELHSGHTEQAIACMQAMLEYNFFSPEFDGALPFASFPAEIV